MERTGLNRAGARNIDMNGRNLGHSYLREVHANPGANVDFWDANNHRSYGHGRDSNPGNTGFNSGAIGLESGQLRFLAG